jgi:hypothetical protein
MDVDPKRTTATTQVEVLEELMNAIRRGDQRALEEFHRTISPGVRFLLERRLGKGHADETMGVVIETVVREIRADVSLQPGALLSFVQTKIHQEADSRRNEREAGKPGAQPPGGLRIAQGVLDRMSPLEQDALRRCYVAREPADKIMARLSLTPDQFLALKLRARAEFSTASRQEAQVA